MQLLRLLPFGLLICTNALAQAERIFPKSDGSEMTEALLRERRHQPADTDKPPVKPPVFYPVPYWTRGILQPYSKPVSRPWLKFDAVNQQLYSRSATDEPVVVNMADLRAFAVGDSLLGTRHVYRRYLGARLKDAALRTAFFEVRYDAGHIALLCHHKSYVNPSDLADIRKGYQVKARIVEKIVYYLKSADHNTITPIILREDVVLEALGPVHLAELTTYTRQKRLKLNRERDVIALLAYLDKL